MKQILIWGNDPRFEILESELKKMYLVDRYNNETDISKYDIIILPMKGISDTKSLEIIRNSKENVIIYTGLKNNLEYLNRNVISFLDDNNIKDENDNITVDGIIEYLKNIESDKICLLGYGHIGKKLYQKIKDKIVSIGIIEEDDKLELGDISFYTTDKTIMQEKLNNSDLIINTVPQNIITYEMASDLKTPILDIASSPYCISKEIIDEFQLNYFNYSGIPGKYDPKRAGKILYKKINNEE